MSAVSRCARDRLAITGWRLAAGVHDVVGRFRLLGLLQRLRSLLPAKRRRAERAHAVAMAILADVRGKLEAGPWRLYEMMPTDGDVAVMGTGPTTHPSRALIKIAETPAAAEGLECQRKVLVALHAEERLGEWRRLIPRVIDAGESGGVAYLIEERLPGTSLEHALARPGLRDAALRAAVEAIGQLHRVTARETTASHEILERCVSDPLRVVGVAVRHFRESGRALAALGCVSDRLREALEGQAITLSWVHGDYWPGNILAGPDGRLTAIVDWEYAHPDDLSLLDIVNFFITVRMSFRRQEFGHVVADLVANATWTEAEAQLVALAQNGQVSGTIGIEAMVLLCWLRHVASMITRRSAFAKHSLWMHANVHTVLDSLA